MKLISEAAKPMLRILADDIIVRMSRLGFAALESFEQRRAVFEAAVKADSSFRHLLSEFSFAVGGDIEGAFAQLGYTADLWAEAQRILTGAGQPGAKA